MLRFLFAFVVCFSLLHLSVLVDADVICPPFEAISPCDCYDYTTTEFVRTNTTYLYCYYKYLTDSQMSDILDAYLATPNVSPVGRLQLSFNLLTRVPVQVKSFTQLVIADLSGNSFESGGITSIESGAFNIADGAYPLETLFLDHNQLTTIAPGAFKGSNFVYFFPLPFNCY